MWFKVSFKTLKLTLTYQRWKFKLDKCPCLDECDFVLVFYYQENVITYISVICASRVYDSGIQSFGWSTSHETDILKYQIHVNSSNVLDALSKKLLAWKALNGSVDLLFFLLDASKIGCLINTY